MPKRRSRKQRSSKSNPFAGAPRQGLGETQDWIVNDIQAVTVPQSINPGFYTVRLSLDANGFSWTVGDGTSTVTSYPSNSYFLRYQPYGTENGQFDRLAQLWNQYRTDWIQVEYQPVAGSGQYAPTSIFTVVDETGNLSGSQAQGDLIPKISSYRNVKMSTPYQRAQGKFDYARWLGQTNSTAWKQTQAPGSTLILREQYETPLNDPSFPSAAPRNAAPALAMIFGVNVATSVASVIGTLRVRVKYTFRQRNLLTGAPFFEVTDVDGRRYLPKLPAKQESAQADAEETIDLSRSTVEALVKRCSLTS